MQMLHSLRPCQCYTEIRGNQEKFLPDFLNQDLIQALNGRVGEMRTSEPIFAFQVKRHKV